MCGGVLGSRTSLAACLCGCESRVPAASKGNQGLNDGPAAVEEAEQNIKEKE